MDLCETVLRRISVRIAPYQPASRSPSSPAKWGSTRKRSSSSPRTKTRSDFARPGPDQEGACGLDAIRRQRVRAEGGARAPPRCAAGMHRRGQRLERPARDGRGAFLPRAARRCTRSMPLRLVRSRPRRGERGHRRAGEELRSRSRGDARAITPETRVVFIANPNNPTGTFATGEEIENFLSRAPRDVAVVWTEATPTICLKTCATTASPC